MSEVGRPNIDSKQYLTEIAPYLSLGFSLHKACTIAEIPYSTVMDYYHGNSNFRNKCDKLSYEPSIMARRAWLNEIKGGNYKAAKEWLERKEKNEFSISSLEQVTNSDIKVIYESKNFPNER